MKSAGNFVFVIILSFFAFSLDVFGQDLPASPIRTIYVIPSSHYDLGFVEPPNAIRERAARHLDEVIRVAEEDKDFRWTIESVWQVNEWLKRAKKPSSVLPKDNPKIARLMALIKSGRIALSTAWGSMHTDYMGAEELNRMVYGYAALHNTYEVSSEMAYMNDVPGHPMPVISVLADSGTKYLVTGANAFLNNATDLAPGKVPFYWQAPDGRKVLLWVSQGNRGAYVEAFAQYYLDPYSLDPYTGRRPFDMFNPELAGKKSDIGIMEAGVSDLLNTYNKAGYKYDAVMAMYAHDFFEPSNVENLERAIKLWNSKHDEVKLRIGTAPEFFKYIEGKYGSQIPTYRGDWSGLWSEAKTASPRIAAIGRYNHDHAPAAETLWSAISMTRRIPYPAGNFSRIYDLMFTFDEHSGAGNTGWPQLNSSGPLEKQNQEYVEFTHDAKAAADEMLTTGIRALADPGRYDNRRPATSARMLPLVVYNGLSWERTDVVRFKPPAEHADVVGIRTAAGAAIPFDIDDDGNVVFVAKDVPSMGYAAFELVTASGKPSSTLRHVPGNSAENARFAVRLNDDGTIQSIRDKTANRELVNTAGERSFNDLLRVEGSDASVVTYPIAARIVIKKGTQMTVVNVFRERSPFPVSRITIFDGLDRVELHNELDPKMFPFPGGSGNWSDSYYFAFPFKLSSNGLQVMRGGQRYFDRLPEDYLSGARKDSVSTQHLFGFTDGRGSALIAHRQAFHWAYPGYVAAKLKPQGAPADFPAMYTGKFPLPEATIYSRAIRYGRQADTHDVGIFNLSSTEPGLKGNMVFEYAFAGDGPFDPVRAWRFGASFDLPLRPEFTSLEPTPATRSFFSVDQPNVQIVVVKTQAENVIRGEVSSTPLNPPVNKVFVVRLQEFAGRAAAVSLSVPAKVRAAALMNLTETAELSKITEVSPVKLSLKPFEAATVRIEIE